MVETAVKHAVAVQVLPEVEESEEELDLAEIEAQVDDILAESPPEPEPPKPEPLVPAVKLAAPAPPAPELSPAKELAPTKEVQPAKEIPLPKKEETAAPKKPLFWSAALRTQASTAPTPEAAESIAAPPVLRNLQKCKACGFPVSQGRTFCVECEEKQWRTQRPPQSAAAAAIGAAPHQEIKTQPAPEPAIRAVVATAEIAVTGIGVTKNSSSTKTEEPVVAPSIPAPADKTEEIAPSEPIRHNSTLFLSSAQPSESWLAANKYILGALLLVAITIAVIAWLR
jgi:hypothetical protein